MRIIIAFIIVSVFSISFSETIVSLNGRDWIVTNANKSIKVSAHIPGSIYTDLRRNNIIEDPYVGNNDVHLRWIGRDNWTYERSFEIEDSILNRKGGVFLVCHGIDTVSKIYVNNALIGSTDNMFVRYKFNVKHLLKVGLNHIKVAFESPVEYAKRKSDENIREKHYSIPPDCPPNEQHGECHVNFIRKMQASFSWDWGPSFPTQGIWKNIAIEALDTGVIRDVTVETHLLHSQWNLNLNIFMDSARIADFNGKLDVYLNNRLLFTKTKTFEPNSHGIVKENVKLLVHESIINKWWPNEVSNGTQSLYDLRIHFFSETTKEESTKTLKIGFRTIELVQDSIKPSGLTFYFKVNGVPFYAKGANWIPAHVFPELLTEEYIRGILQSAKDSHMNMMRVWGGGIYESDKFYEIADEMGIMIWQDFMFACALYPTDEHFIDSVSTEITQQIRRLQHHPSIAIWSGNNENEGAISSPWYPIVRTNTSLYYRDYIKLTVNVTYAIVKEEDTSRPFVPSSPTNGLETEKEHWIAKNPQDTRYGDVHYYNYGNSAWNWKIYPSSKFTSEYGFQSYPSIETWSKVTKSSDWTYPISAAIEHRQHHGGGTQQIEGLIGNYMKLPSHGGAERFEDLIYLSQIGQAMAIKTETEFYRRNREIDSNGNGYTMGALYWQLNDIWQCPSWASIEYGGKWKMLQYYAKHMFNNLLVSPYEDDNEIMKISIVRDDHLESLNFNFTLKTYKWSDATQHVLEKSVVNTNSFTAQLVYNHSIPDILKSSKCDNRNECLIVVEIDNSQHKLYANNFMILGPLKNAFGMKKPNLRVNKVMGPNQLSKHMYEYDIHLETDFVTPFVWIDFKSHSNINGTFSDNGFVMFETQKHILFYSKTSISSDELKSKLTLKSLTDVQ